MKMIKAMKTLKGCIKIEREIKEGKVKEGMAKRGENERKQVSCRVIGCLSSDDSSNTEQSRAPRIASSRSLRIKAPGPSPRAWLFALWSEC